MRIRSMLPLGLVSLAACATISEAPEGSPRVEAELIVLVDGSVHDTLTFEPLPDTVEERYASIIAPLTDLGSRFYAVPTEAYEQGHARPDYILTVELASVTPRLAQEKVKVEEGEQLATRVVGLLCTVSAKVERRRKDAPTLPVGRGVADSELTLARIFKAEQPPVAMISLRQRPESGESLEIRADDFDTLVERAALRALRQLEGPVDRELALQSTVP